MSDLPPEIMSSLFIVIFAVGVLLGSRLTEGRFLDNAEQPQRMLCRGRFYKMYRLDEDDWTVKDDPAGHLPAPPPARMIRNGAVHGYQPSTRAATPNDPPKRP